LIKFFGDSKLKKKGLVIVFTGKGKGKTTAALGMALRASGHNMKTLVVQFIKNFKNYGELKFAQKYISGIQIKAIGKGYVGIRGDNKPLSEHQEEAKKALDFAKERIFSGKYDIVILDEINIALNLKLLSVSEVLKLIKEKPKELHLVLTGRNAPKGIIKVADLVTEMKEVKHPFRKGVLAQKGVEF
jgi:cob(I)alamin adenosyltransferase